MNKTYSKILGIAVTLALLASLILGVIPVAANVSPATVTPNPTTISSPSVYTIKFDSFFSLVIGDTISIKFPTGTTVPAAIAAGDITVNTVATTAAATIVGQEVTFPTPVATTGATHNTVVFLIAANITNPGTPGSYAISVKTQQETTYVDSSAYNIVVPGLINIYNDAGNFIGTSTTFAGLPALAAKSILKVGPGTYEESYNIAVASVKLETTGSAADTTIKGTLTISADKVVVDDITVKGLVVVAAGGTNATIQNSVINKSSSTASANLVTVGGTGFTLKDSTVDTTSGDIDDKGVRVGADTALISNVKFLVDQSAVLAADEAIDTSALVTGLTVEKSTFTGSSGVGFEDTFGSTATIKNNTFSSLEKAINLTGAGTFTIQGNTIEKSTKDTVGAIDISGAVAAAKIESNTIKDNLGYSVRLSAAAVPANIIVAGNSFSGNVKGFTNGIAAAVNAILNWWGSDKGPTTADVTGGDKVSTNVTYKPFLTSKPDTARTFVKTVATVESLDASTTSGVAIMNVTAAAGTVMSGQKLAANPKTVAPPYTSIAYFDVYVSAASTTDIQVKLYAPGIKTNTQAYFWSGVSNSWIACSSQGIAGTGDYVYVNLTKTASTTPSTPNADDLGGTPFVLVAGAEPAPKTIELVSNGANDKVGLTNVGITWKSVAGATGYKVTVSANADLSKPVVNNVAVTAAAYNVTATLTDAVTYFWQVTALNGTAVIGKSDVGTFVAAAPAKPVTPAPPVTITSVPAPVITITQPAAPPATTITVNPPAQAPIQQITPAWIWGIIGIGAILIIAVIVLIVRTRRTA